MDKSIKKEVWKNIPGYKGLYKASNLGRVYSIPHIAKNVNGVVRQVGGRIRKPHVHGVDEQVRVSLYHYHGSEKHVTLARVIAKAFLPNYSSKMMVIHKNGNLRDNRVSNLECLPRGSHFKTVPSTGNRKGITLIKGNTKKHFKQMKQASKWLKSTLGLSTHIKSIYTRLARNIKKGKKVYGFKIITADTLQPRNTSTIKNEKWVAIPGYEHLYQVSNYGRVRSIPRVVKTSDGEIQHYKAHMLRLDGSRPYFMVRLSKNNHTKKFMVHRLVAKVFVPNPHHYPVVNHKDENQRDNKASNLEWCTYTYNNNYGDFNERLSRSLGYPINLKSGSMVYQFGSIKDCSRWLKKTLHLSVSYKTIALKVINSCRNHKSVYGCQARYVNHRKTMRGKYTSLIH